MNSIVIFLIFSTFNFSSCHENEIVVSNSLENAIFKNKNRAILETKGFVSEQCTNSIANNNDSAQIKRFKRSFGGPEPMNLTFVNTNISPVGWVSMASGGLLDMFFHVQGYTVLGKSIGTPRNLINLWKKMQNH